MAIERRYVVDTNALIWYLTGDQRLTAPAKAIFAAAEAGQTRLILSAIVLAELYYANRKGGFFPDFRRVYQRVVSADYFRVIPFNADAVLDFDRHAAVPEMRDA
jgi:predicted nucleic acid-binding protein